MPGLTEGGDLEADDIHQDEEHSAQDGRDERAATILRKCRQISREQFLAMVSASDPRPAEFHSQQANMMQLYQSFLNLYMPHDGDQKTLMAILTTAPSSPAILAASQSIWALLLQQPSLLPSAISLYSEALRRARQEVIDPQTDKCTIIGTAHLLSLCELFQRLSLDDAGTTRPHARWLVSFMEDHRDDIANEGMQRFRHSNVRLVAAWEMLIARKYSDRGTSLRHRTGLSAGTVTTMSDLTLLTASLLEKSDNFCRPGSDPCPSSVLDTLERIVSLEGSLHEWMAAFLNPFSGSPYRLIEPKSLPYTTGRGTRSQFRHLYEFRDLQTQMLHLSFWMCQLMLIDGRIDIVNSHHRKLDSDPADLIRLKLLASEYASHLSKSMPTMRSPYAAWAGRIMAVRPLHLLLLYYKKHHEWQKLSWCVECAKDMGILVDRVAKRGSGSAEKACQTTLSTRSIPPSN